MSLLSLVLPVLNQPDATEDVKVNNAFTAIQTWANGNIDASNMAPGLTIPSGMIAPFGGTSAPAGWLFCNGAAISRSAYAQLFSVIGSAYGAGDGSSTFNLPNLIGRTLVGYDGAGAVIPGGANVGWVGGVATYALQNSEMPVHSHGGATQNTDVNHVHYDSGHAHGVSDPGHNHGVNDPSHTHSIGGDVPWYQTTSTTHIQTAATSYDFNRNPVQSLNNSYNFTGISIQNHATGIGIGNGAANIGYMSANNLHSHPMNNDGGGAAHTNMQPSVAVYYVIKT